MDFRSYNSEIQIATAQTIDVFNDIVIDRRTSKNEVQKLIRVPCLYGARSRILKSQENRNGTLKLPILCVLITGISRDTSRVHSVNDSLNFQTSFEPDKINLSQNIAVPVNITYSLSIITKYQEDMDQIASNFMAMMNPDIYVVWPNPKNPEENLKSQIIWDGSINISYNEEIGDTDPARITGDASFTYKTWIFPGLFNDIKNGPTIKKFNYVDITGASEGELVNSPISGLYAFFDVQYVTIEQYLEAIRNNLIKEPNFDVWPLGF
jgi:hypothetical protein